MRREWGGRRGGSVYKDRSGMLSEQVTELRLEYREGLVMQRSRSEQRQREELLQSPRGSKEKNLRREGRALRWRYMKVESGR